MLIHSCIQFITDCKIIVNYNVIISHEMIGKLNVSCGVCIEQSMRLHEINEHISRVSCRRSPLLFSISSCLIDFGADCGSE